MASWAMVASAAATVGQCQRLHLVVESSFLARSRLTSYCAQQAYVTSNERASQILGLNLRFRGTPHPTLCSYG